MELYDQSQETGQSRKTPLASHRKNLSLSSTFLPLSVKSVPLAHLHTPLRTSINLAEALLQVSTVNLTSDINSLPQQVWWLRRARQNFFSRKYQHPIILSSMSSYTLDTQHSNPLSESLRIESSKWISDFAVRDLFSGLRSLSNLAHSSNNRVFRGCCSILNEPVGLVYML